MLRHQSPGYHHLEALKLLSPLSLCSSQTYIHHLHLLNPCLIILLLVAIIIFITSVPTSWSLLCWEQYRWVRYSLHLPWSHTRLCTAKGWIKIWGKESSCKCNQSLHSLQALHACKAQMAGRVCAKEVWQRHTNSRSYSKTLPVETPVHFSSECQMCLSFKSSFLGTAD